MADGNLQRGWKGSVAHRRIGELVEDEQHVFIGLLVQTVRDEVEGILPERECGQCGRHAEETVYGSRIPSWQAPSPQGIPLRYS